VGDMGEMYRELRSRKKERRLRNLAEADPTGWKQHTEYHWSRQLAGKQLDYWPSTRKWQYDGKIFTGNVQTFVKEHEA